MYAFAKKNCLQIFLYKTQMQKIELFTYTDDVM